jgi:hypothetical protein
MLLWNIHSITKENCILPGLSIFKSVPVYLYCTIYRWYFLLKFEHFSWKSGGTKDHFRQVKMALLLIERSVLLHLTSSMTLLIILYICISLYIAQDLLYGFFSWIVENLVCKDFQRDFGYHHFPSSLWHHFERKH